MKRVLITGMSATGKSTVIAELARRGYRTVDTDHGGWTEPVDVPGGGREWLWHEDRMAELLSAGDGEIRAPVRAGVGDKGAARHANEQPVREAPR